MHAKIKKILSSVEKLEDWLLILMLSVMVLLAVAQIFYRNILGDGLLWADPMLRTLVLWVALSGAVIATRTDNHIRIDFFTRYISKRFCSCLHRIVYAFSIAVCSLIAWHALRFVLDEYEYGGIAFLNVPTWFTASIIPIGFSLMAFRYLLLFISPPEEFDSYNCPEDES